MSDEQPIHEHQWCFSNGNCISCDVFITSMPHLNDKYKMVPGNKHEYNDLKERFRKVVRMAGYQGDRIVAEYFDGYYAHPDRQSFIKMMEEYEQAYAKDGEII